MNAFIHYKETLIAQVWRKVDSPKTQDIDSMFFACGHRPKTKELLLLLLFSIWFISSLKGI